MKPGSLAVELLPGRLRTEREFLHEAKDHKFKPPNSGINTKFGLTTLPSTRRLMGAVVEHAEAGPDAARWTCTQHIYERLLQVLLKVVAYYK